MSERIIGTVKWFNNRKGWGFISVTKKRIFLSITQAYKGMATEHLPKVRRSNFHLTRPIKDYKQSMWL